MGDAITKRYNDAVQSFVEKVKTDPNVIAVLVYGSVSHGTVWEKSDIDISVIVRDQKLDRKSFGIYEDNLLLCVEIAQRSDLKRWMEKNTAGLWGHSIDATTKIVYTTDESLYEYIEENRGIGQADAEKAIFNNVNWLIGLMEKVEKWLVVKKDPEYARFYLLKAVEVMAQIEVCARFIVPTREALLQVRELNPGFYEKYYGRPMSGPMAEDEIYALLRDMTDYILTHMGAIMNVAGELFGDGEIKTGTMIARHFKSDMHMMHSIMDFLCEHGGLEKLSQTIRLTPKGRQNVEEVAYILPLE
jgi:predicted nucleotidyltransferase